VTQTPPDPSVQWSAQLSRLDDLRRRAAVTALRRSAASGWPASREAVELLVDYALGAITSREYAAGIVRTWAVTADEQSGTNGVPAPARATVPTSSGGPIGREGAVHAYVTGLIDVGEFLRIARS
jgi:hypothetical protein